MCSNKEIFDPRVCSCRCLIDSYPCPFNEEFNRDICDCERLPDCPELVNDTCPPGQVFSLVNCTCVPECTLTSCDSPKRLDANLCACVCPPGILPRSVKCPPPLVYSEDTCFCECPLDQSQCGSGQVGLYETVIYIIYNMHDFFQSTMKESFYKHYMYKV